MKVNQAEFVISAVGPAQYPEDGLPEIALAGRSNVGKSSLINKMIARKNLARTSSQPGKTQTLNFYAIDAQLYLVDLPGYGYAQVAQGIKAGWGSMMERYLLRSERLALVVQLLDMRHPPSREDRRMYEWLGEAGRAVLLVATKADKLSKGQWMKQNHMIQRELSSSTLPIPFSSLNGIGRDEVHQAIENHLRGE